MEMTLGKRIATLRKEKGITQGVVGNLMEVEAEDGTIVKIFVE